MVGFVPLLIRWSPSERVAVMAASIMLERGYGKPEQKADVDVVHRFAVVPQVMEQAQWLANRRRMIRSGN